ncbi:MAG: peptide deformylase [Patescibacteria group bacterium]
MLQILTNPNPILRQKSVLVADFTNEEVQKLVPEMAETMLKKDGLGLAAPQIGKNIRLIVVSHKDGVLALFNPKIIKKSWFKEWGEEGCLSLPDKYGEVKRHKNITVKFDDTTGKSECLEAKGLLARVIQHEIDHLDGVLFIDKARKIVNIDK